MSAARRNDDEALPAGVLELFQRMVERDGSTRDQLAHATSRLTDLASVMSNMQGELGRLVTLAERQEEFNRQQLVMAERQATHATTFDRAFTEIEGVRRDFTTAAQELSAKIEEAASAVIAHRSGTAALRWVVVTFMPVALLLTGFVYQVSQERIDDARQDAAIALMRLEQRLDERNEMMDRERAELRAAVADLKKAEDLR